MLPLRMFMSLKTPVGIERFTHLSAGLGGGIVRFGRTPRFLTRGRGGRGCGFGAICGVSH